MVELSIFSRWYYLFWGQKQRHLNEQPKDEQQYKVGRRFLFKEGNHTSMLLIKFDFSKANVIAVVTRQNQLTAANLFSKL